MINILKINIRAYFDAIVKTIQTFPRPVNTPDKRYTLVQTPGPLGLASVQILRVCTLALPGLVVFLFLGYY
jgi:hypothetical protein